MPRIKRFDEIDTDSDLEFEEEAVAKKTMPTLSFKTATEDTDSVAFESEHEKSVHSEKSFSTVPSAPKAPLPPASVPVKVLSAGVPPPPNLVKAKKAPPTAVGRQAMETLPQQSSAPPAPKSLPPSTTAGQPTVPTSMPGKQQTASTSSANSQETTAMPVLPIAASPVERPSHQMNGHEATPPPRAVTNVPPSPASVGPSVTAIAPHKTSKNISNNTAQYHNDAEESEHESDDFVQQVLPVHTRQRPQQSSSVPSNQRPSSSGAPQLWTSGSTDMIDSSKLRSAPPDTAADELLIRAQLRLEERRRLGGNSAPRGSSRQQSPWRGAPPVPLTPYRESAAWQAVTPMSPLTSTDPRVRRLQQENARLQDEVAFLSRENQKMRAVQSSADASEAVRLQLTVDMLRKDLETKQITFQRALDDAYAEKNEALRQAGEVAEQCEGYQSSAEQYKHLYSEKQREVEKVKTQLQALLYDVNSLEQRNREMEAEYKEKIASEREKTERALALSEDVKGQRDHLQFLNEQLRSELTVAAEAKREAVEQVAVANDAARRDRADFEQRIGVLNQDIEQLRKALVEKDRVQAAHLRDAQQAQAVLQDRLKEQAEEQQRETERSRRALEIMREDQKRTLQQERARRAEVEERLQRVEEEARANQTRYAASVGAETETRVRKFREELQAERLAREKAEREVSRLAGEVETLRDASEYYQQECQRISANFSQSEQLREKAERQCVSLTHTLEDMMAQEDTHARQIEQLQEALSASQWRPAGAVGGSVDTSGMVSDLQQLSDENDRLTNECTRLAEERDNLIEENGKIAKELLKWKHEMRQYVTSHVRSPSPQRHRMSTNAP